MNAWSWVHNILSIWTIQHKTNFVRYFSKQTHRNIVFSVLSLFFNLYIQQAKKKNINRLNDKLYKWQIPYNGDGWRKMSSRSTRNFNSIKKGALLLFYSSSKIWILGFPNFVFYFYSLSFCIFGKWNCTKAQAKKRGRHPKIYI